MTRVIEVIVDDTKAVLALDYYYRLAMKKYETETLLPYARTLKEKLNPPVYGGPVEGYYHETEELREYFITIKSLMQLYLDNFKGISASKEFRELNKVFDSNLYGPEVETSDFFNIRKNSVNYGLSELDCNDWKIEDIINKSIELTEDKDDYSLLGIALQTKNPVIVAALRETIVLYSVDFLGDDEEDVQITYKWNVSEKVERLINLFIRDFQGITGLKIPLANKRNASEYSYGASENRIENRCVMVGDCNGKFYHWGVKYNEEKGEFEVDEFWDKKIWTTEMYCEKIDLTDEWDGTFYSKVMKVLKWIWYGKDA